jgi:hypothetical protein
LAKDRRAAVGSAARRVDMVVLAGLPPEHCTWAVESLQSRARVAVGAPSAARDGVLYPTRVVQTLLKAAVQFAARRRSQGPLSPIHPNFVTLLYVRSPDEEALLSAFDFAVLPVPLGVLGVYGETGRMLRHERAAVQAELGDAFAPGARANAAAGEVRQRVDRRSEADALLLPPANFRVNRGDLTAMFKEYRSGFREPRDRFPELSPTALNSDALPRLAKDEVRRVHVDERDLAFLHADDVAFHGHPRELPEDAESEAHRSLLRTLYRFGGALLPGFHHDVQRRDGREMLDTPFDCCVAGSVTVSGSHANVYPNDFVRAKGKE